MHFLSLELKRAHWAAVGATQDIAEEYGLTPARFDLLYVIFARSVHAGSQARVARYLGFSGATISRMLKSLEVLELVERRTAPNDRRAKAIRLTRKGLDLMKVAARALVDQRTIHRIFQQRVFGLGERALQAARNAADSLSARRAYRDALAVDRERVFHELVALFTDVGFVVGKLRGRPPELVYRTFHPDE